MKYPSLLFLTLAVVLSIGIDLKVAGYICFFLALLFALASKDRSFIYHISVIALPLAVLTLIDINTDTSNAHIFVMGGVCLFALVFPYVALKKVAPLKYKWFSKKQFESMALAYLVLAFTLAYFLLPWYFHTFPSVPAMWPQPTNFSIDSFIRLFVGTNALGLWDELFFINIVFVSLLRFFPFRIALVAQAAMFTSFLHDLGFVAIGPFLIGTFALLQGLAFKKTESLSYVITLHLLIDAVLFMTIINYYYPGSFLLFG